MKEGPLMDDLTDQLAGLDDASAERVLAEVTSMRLPINEAAKLPLTAELGLQLAAAAGIALPAGPISAAELARRCLFVLATRPTYQPVLRELVENPRVSSGTDPRTVLLSATAAFAILQTRVKIERGSAGSWRIQFAKELPINQALREMIGALCAYLVGR
jgi:hypothetical protein